MRRLSRDSRFHIRRQHFIEAWNAAHPDDPVDSKTVAANKHYQQAEREVRRQAQVQRRDAAAVSRFYRARLEYAGRAIVRDAPPIRETEGPNSGD